MSSYRRSAGSLNDATQRQSGQDYQRTGNTLAMNANASSSTQYHAAIRFENNPLTHSPLETIRRVRLNLRYTSATTGAKFDIYGHKVVNSPAMKNSTGAGTDDVVSRLSALTTANVQVRMSAAPDTSLAYEYDVSDIVREIIAQGSWASGNPITFLLKSYSDATYTTVMSSFDQADPSKFAELYVEYGTVDGDAFNLDVVGAGESLAVTATAKGAVATNVQIAAPGWNNQVIAATYIGAVSNVSGVNYFGSVAGQGDQRRGYTDKGILQDSLEAKYGADGVIVYRSEYALGGTTAAAWATDTTNTSGGGLWDHPVGTQPSLNSRIANPLSPSKRMILWLSLIGNDIFAFAQSSAGRIVPRGSGWGSLDWSDAGDPTKFRNKMVAALETCITHALAIATANGTDLRIVLPGYHNFQVMGNSPAAWHYAPDVTGQPLEREVWGTSSFGFYAQVDYDGIQTSIRSGQDRFHQSTYVQFAAEYQINAYGSWDPNNAFTWNASLAAVSTTPISSPRTWTHSIASTSVDGWKHAFRNITDVTVNQYVVGETHAIIQRVLDLHPAWKGRVFFLPHPQAVNAVQGTDEARSADPDSIYAQPLWQGDPAVTPAPVGQYEGFHHCAMYTRIHVDAVVDDMDEKISFLPGYIPPTETVTATLSVIDATGAIIDPAPTHLVVGQRYQRDYQITALGGDLNGFFINVDDLDLPLDGGATLRLTKVPSATVVLAETAISEGDTFTGLGNIIENETWRARIRGTVVG